MHQCQFCKEVHEFKDVVFLSDMGYWDSQHEVYGIAMTYKICKGCFDHIDYGAYEHSPLYTPGLDIPYSKYNGVSEVANTVHRAFDQTHDFNPLLGCIKYHPHQ